MIVAFQSKSRVGQSFSSLVPYEYLVGAMVCRSGAVRTFDEPIC